MNHHSCKNLPNAISPISLKTSYKIMFMDFSWISAIFLKQLKTRLLPVKVLEKKCKKEIMMVWRSLVLLYARRKKGKFQILGLVDLGTIFSTCSTRLIGFGWFNLVRDRDSKVRGPRSKGPARFGHFISGSICSYQSRSVCTRFSPFVTGMSFSFQFQAIHRNFGRNSGRIFYGDTCCESNQDLFLVTEIFLILK